MVRVVWRPACDSCMSTTAPWRLGCARPCGQGLAVVAVHQHVVRIGATARIEDGVAGDEQPGPAAGKALVQPHEPVGGHAVGRAEVSLIAK